MLLFRSEEHVDRWSRAREIPRGATLTPEQGWRLAHGWYRNKLQPDWDGAMMTSTRPKTFAVS